MSKSSNEVREYLDKLVEDTIHRDCNSDSILANVLLTRTPAARRTIVIGGMMRLARQADHYDRMERLTKYR